MRKRYCYVAAFLVMLLLALPQTVSAVRESVIMSVGGVYDAGSGGLLPKMPRRSPSVQIEGHSLYFQAAHPDWTLNIIKDGEVVYATPVPDGVSQVELPANLEGEYELLLVCAPFVFKGFITL